MEVGYSFESQVVNNVKQKIINEVKNIDFLKFDYHNRQALPKEFIDKLWGEINWDEVIERIRPEIQKRICNKIISSMEEEIKTDVKKIVGIGSVREKIRTEVYPKLMQVLKDD